MRQSPWIVLAARGVVSGIRAVLLALVGRVGVWGLALPVFLALAVRLALLLPVLLTLTARLVLVWRLGLGLALGVWLSLASRGGATRTLSAGAATLGRGNVRVLTHRCFSLIIA